MLCLDMDKEPVTSWVKSRPAIVGDVCYTPPDEGVVVDEVFFRQLEESSRLPALVFMGNLNRPGICWSDKTAVLPWQYRRFWERSDDNCQGEQGDGTLIGLILTTRRTD